jgi:alpha-tubulin suppressor-like RCC1 family protein
VKILSKKFGVLVFGSFLLACGKDTQTNPTPMLDMDMGGMDANSEVPDLDLDMRIERALTLTLDTPAMVVGGAQSMQVEYTEDGQARAIEARDLSWHIEPSELLERDALEITAVAPGEANITACLDEACDTQQVVISPGVSEPDSLSIEPSSMVLRSQQEASVALLLFDQEDNPLPLSPEDVQWTSSDDTVGFAEGFTVYALAQGETTLEATVHGKMARLSLSVRYLDHLEIMPSTSSSFVAGEQATLTVIASSDDGIELARPAPSEVSWTFSDLEIASIQDDNISFEQPGKLTLQASWEGITGESMYTSSLKWETFSCGSVNCCGVSTHGETYCWGKNEGLVMGQSTNSFYPVHIETPSSLVFISVGFHEACGLDVAGKAWCWGENGRATVGDGTRTPRPDPVPIAPMLTFEKIVASDYGTTCALTSQQELYCWGAFPTAIWRNTNASQPQDATVYQAPSKMTEALIRDFTLGAVLCARRDADGVWMCQGENEDGQLGDGTKVPRETFFDVPGSASFKQVVSGSYHTCALDMLEQVWCWGTNVEEGLGHPLPDDATDPTNREFLEPTRTAWPNKYQRLYGERSRAWCGISESGIECWGGNATCLLNEDSSEGSHLPRLITDDDFLHFEMGGWFACLLTPERDITCWGVSPHGPGAYPPNINNCSEGFTTLQSFEP